MGERALGAGPGPGSPRRQHLRPPRSVAPFRPAHPGPPSPHTSRAPSSFPILPGPQPAQRIGSQTPRRHGDRGVICVAVYGVPGPPNPASVHGPLGLRGAWGGQARPALLSRSLPGPAQGPGSHVRGGRGAGGAGVTGDGDAGTPSPRFSLTTTTGLTGTRRTRTTPTASCWPTSTPSTSRPTTTWSVAASAPSPGPARRPLCSPPEPGDQQRDRAGAGSVARGLLAVPLAPEVAGGAGGAGRLAAPRRSARLRTPAGGGGGEVLGAGPAPHVGATRGCSHRQRCGELRAGFFALGKGSSGGTPLCPHTGPSSEASGETSHPRVCAAAEPGLEPGGPRSPGGLGSVLEGVSLAGTACFLGLPPPRHAGPRSEAPCAGFNTPLSHLEALMLLRRRSVSFGTGTHGFRVPKGRTCR